jgi:RHS repeat-associated protein
VAFVSVIAPSAIGFFRVNPIGIGVGTNGVATINYDNGVAGMTVIAPIASDGTITVAATTAADVVVDVTGYMTTPTWTYRYSSDGLRSAKTGPTGVRTEFTWTAHGGLALLLGQHRGTATTWVIQGPGGQPVQQINPDSTVTWLHHDQLGSVRLGTNSSGNNVSARSWDAYGNPATASAGTATPILGYAGEYTDTETGYIYLRARYYDPTSGQFLTRDPLFAMTGEPYGYTGGNPTNATDPTGLFRIPGTNICVDIADPNCRSIKEQNPAAAQAAADGAAGVLDTATGGNADRVLQGLGVDDRVRWESPAMQIGRVAGFGLAAVFPASAFLAAITVGGVVNAFDTSISCVSGGGGRLCGVDSVLAIASVLVPYGAGRSLAFLGPEFGMAAQYFLSVVGTAFANGWAMARCS